MENQIICPKCKKMIVISAIISDEAQGEGSFSRHLLCDCGERISYWRIAAQIQEHKRMSWKFQNWIQSLSHSHA
jgi:hypothetical protein